MIPNAHKPVIFTNHSKQRLQLLGIQLRHARKLFRASTKEQTPHPKLKLKKYGNNPDISYWNFGTTVFVVKKKFIQRLNQEAYLVITVSDKRLSKTYYKHIELPPEPHLDFLKQSNKNLKIIGF